jgi:hypothetical protein
MNLPIYHAIAIILRLTWAWGLAAIAALLWPSRLSGPLDGVPLDAVAEGLLIGVVFPALLWFHPTFLKTRLARTAIVVVILLKAFASYALVRDGWCVQFEPGRPLVKDATSNVPHSWDVRADWLADQPACSAVMTRPYTGIGEFPVWFFNLPPAGGGLPVEGDRPPTARTGMTVNGFLDVPRAGDLSFEFGRDMEGQTAVVVDGLPAPNGVRLEAGTHRIHVESTLTGVWWRFVPLWNGADLWSSPVMPTMRRPSTLDRALRPAGAWLVAVIVAVWLASWIGAFFWRIRSPIALAWMLVVSAIIGALVATDHLDAARWSVLALAGAALLPVPARLRNLTGVVALLAIPWLTLIVVTDIGAIGKFHFYGLGQDYWTFQRYAYRIVLQGYWLEGGTPTFWFQPFYRWIVGLLHLAFGDSSVGERFWDGACVLASALFAWRVADIHAGFRAGLIAAVLTLGVFAIGTPWPWIGIGLSEVSAIGFLYVGAFFAMRSRHGSMAFAIAAGIAGTLGFYTRLNHGPAAFSLALFALPAGFSMRRLMTTRPWLLPAAWKAAATILLTVAAGLLFFTWRTWHYTGVVNPFFGTSQEFLRLWQPGMSARTVLMREISSVMMVLTVNDPPQFDWRAVPVLAGAAAALLAMLNVPRFRDLPAAPIGFFVAALSSAFIARGWAYSGRFSVHIIGVTCALTVCAVSSLLGVAKPGRGQRRLIAWTAKQAGVEQAENDEDHREHRHQLSEGKALHQSMAHGLGM